MGNTRYHQGWRLQLAGLGSRKTVNGAALKLFPHTRLPFGSSFLLSGKRSVKHVLFLALLACFVGTGFKAAASPLKFVDEVGREVAFAFPPKRIVSLAPNVTEILFSLGWKHPRWC
jgi:hypothetical protein